MAEVLKVTDGTITLDLLSGDLKLESAGWETQTADGAIWEVFGIIGRATDANIRAALENLDNLREKAILFIQDPSRETPVWFYWQSEGESVKRSIVLDITYAPKSRGELTPLLGYRDHAVMQVGIKRAPDYEGDTPTAINTTGISADGGTWAVGAVAGSRPGRIASAEFVTTSAVAQLYKFWVGIKDIRLGTAGFKSTWEAEDGFNYTDASDVADATASGGSKVRISFSSNQDLVKRFGISWGDVGSGNWDDIIGRYLVLGRMKLDALTTIAQVQLRSGWGYTTSPGEILATIMLNGTEDSSLTSWNLFELGEVRIPATGNRDSYASGSDRIKHHSLILHAQRVSGTGLLDVDCFYLIPMDHIVSCVGALVGVESAVSIGKLLVKVGPDGYRYMVNEEYNTLSNLVDIRGIEDPVIERWNYPVENGLMVIAAQETFAHNLGKTIDPTLSIYPRWRGYRT